MRKQEEKSRPLAKSLRKRATDAEKILWSRLKLKSLHGAHFRRQHPIGPYVADFACVSAGFVLEVDGATHSTDAEIAHDRRRDEFMKSRGWHVMRVTNEDVYRNLDNLLEAIFAQIPLPSVAAGAAPATSPARGGGN